MIYVSTHIIEGCLVTRCAEGVRDQATTECRAPRTFDLIQCTRPAAFVSLNETRRIDF
jgi:hypothetical protein